VSNGYKIDHDTTKLLQRTPTSKRVVCVFSWAKRVGCRPKLSCLIIIIVLYKV
jgi:hypothetical protein